MGGQAKPPGGERRTRAGGVVKNMLKERAQLLARMLQLSQAPGARGPRVDEDALREFCQVLVDYVAAGHFGLYERIAGGRERRRALARLASGLLPQLDQTTGIAVAFNEKYAPDEGAPDLERLAEDLSELGEALTTRIELEDRLFAEVLEPSE